MDDDIRRKSAGGAIAAADHLGSLTRGSGKRLFPVRICTMHARTATLDDEIYLVSETTRLLRAIRKADRS